MHALSYPYRPNPSPWPWVIGLVAATGVVGGTIWWLRRKPKLPPDIAWTPEWPAPEYGTVVDQGFFHEKVTKDVVASVRWRVINMGVGSDGTTGGFEAQVMGRGGYIERKSGFYDVGSARTFAVHQAGLKLQTEISEISALLAAA